MPKTSLSLLKLQLNLEHDLDDELLTHKLNAAEGWVRDHTYNPSSGFSSKETEAILQLAAYWYSQREATSFGVSTTAVPFGVYELLSSSKWGCTG